MVIAPNHKSFWDAFFIAAVVRRRLHFMGKSELFRGWRGRLFVALGGFPVLRGESDAEAIATSRAILERGDVLALFPEGTRVTDPEKLGIPHRGATRLAIETGAVIVPTAITGTEKRRWPLPRRVRIAFGEPIPVTDLSPTPEHAGLLLDQTVWPNDVGGVPPPARRTRSRGRGSRRTRCRLRRLPAPQEALTLLSARGLPGVSRTATGIGACLLLRSGAAGSGGPRPGPATGRSARAS